MSAARSQLDRAIAGLFQGDLHRLDPSIPRPKDMGTAMGVTPRAPILQAASKVGRGQCLALCPAAIFFGEALAELTPHHVRELFIERALKIDARLLGIGNPTYNSAMFLRVLTTNRSCKRSASSFVSPISRAALETTSAAP
jgi:hypothetical protein